MNYASYIISALSSWLVIILLFLCIFRRIHGPAFCYSLILLILSVSLSLANIEFGFFSLKGAGFFAYQMHEGTLWNPNFLIQYWFIKPFYWLTETPYLTHSMNAALTAATVYVLFSRFGVPHWKYLLFFIPPAALNFSLFGLRDPVLYFAFLMSSTIFIFSFESKKYLNLILVFAITSVVYIYTRPEIVAFLAAFAVITVYMHPHISQGVKTIFLSVLGTAFVFILYYALDIMGATGVSFDAVSTYAENRYSRHVGTEGGTSQIMGSELFNVPFYVRYPVQIIGTFIVPFPWQVQNISHLLALLDSVLFCYLFYLQVKFARDDKMGLCILLFALVYILGTAFFSANFGNVFRVRYPVYGLILPYILYRMQIERFASSTESHFKKTRYLAT